MVVRLKESDKVPLGAGRIYLLPCKGGKSFDNDACGLCIFVLKLNRVFMLITTDDCLCV